MGVGEEANKRRGAATLTRLAPVGASHPLPRCGRGAFASPKLCIGSTGRPALPVHQVEEDAFADAAVGDAQAADRPGRADRVEDGAAAEDQVGALAPDAGAGGAA